jgi:hypothetical protein
MERHPPKPSTFDWGGLNGPGPQTESARERGFESEADERELGRSDSLDEDRAGDIADEGPGHRG